MIVKNFSSMNEWLYANLDFVEECKEKGLKPICLIGGASSSGKSFLSNQLQSFLLSNNLKSIIISTDNYNNGIAKNIFDIVNKKYYNGTILNKDKIVQNIKDVIISSSFENKFCDENLQKIESLCKVLINVEPQVFLKKLKYEFDHINFDTKTVYDLDQVAVDLSLLSQNKSIQEKQYSKLTSERLENINIINGNDYDVVIVEGIYALDKSVINDLQNANTTKTFVECNDKYLFVRRLIRDSKATNCPSSFIIKNYFEFVSPEYHKNILPTKLNADFIVNNDMSFAELREGTLTSQERYKLNFETLKMVLKNSKFLKNTYLQDIYFGDMNDKDLLRLRLEGTDKNNLSLESLTYKGQQRLRKDNKLVRPIHILCNQNDLNRLFENKQVLMKRFESIGLDKYQTVNKRRIIVLYKGKILKLDYFDRNEIYVEIENVEQELISKNIKKPANLQKTNFEF